MKRLVVIGISLLVMAHKCDKPKLPKAEALEAVEAAWWGAEVADALVHEEAVTVATESESGDVLDVVFARSGAVIGACVIVGGEAHPFRIDRDGYVAELEAAQGRGSGQESSRDAAGLACTVAQAAGQSTTSPPSQ